MSWQNNDMKTSGGSRRRRSVRIGAGAAALAGVLCLGSAALACTTIMGNIKVCQVGSTAPNCSEYKNNAQISTGTVNEADTVKVNGSGLWAKAYYALYWGQPRLGQPPVGCHVATTIMWTPPSTNDPDGAPLDGLDPDEAGPEPRHGMRTDGQGRIDKSASMTGQQPYKALIPQVDLPAGEYAAQICAREVLPRAENTATGHLKIRVVVT